MKIDHVVFRNLCQYFSGEYSFLPTHFTYNHDSVTYADVIDNIGVIKLTTYLRSNLPNDVTAKIVQESNSLIWISTLASNTYIDPSILAEIVKRGPILYDIVLANPQANGRVIRAVYDDLEPSRAWYYEVRDYLISHPACPNEIKFMHSMEK